MDFFQCDQLAGLPVSAFEDLSIALVDSICGDAACSYSGVCSFTELHPLVQDV